MDSQSGVSLFCAVWPQEGTREEKSVTESTRVPRGRDPRRFTENYRRMLTFAQLIFTIAESAADAVLNAQYRQFDAVIKNYGCQMTALDVMEKLQHKGVFNEAARVRQICQEKMQEIAQMFKKPPVGESEQDLLDYLRKAGLDVVISKEFADLVAFRLLNVVHDFKMVHGHEVSFTNLDPLELIKNTLVCKQAGKFVPFVCWIHGLQVKEAQKAVSFIQQHAASRPFDCPRRDRLVQMLSDVRSSQSNIVATAQSYNAEVVIRAIKGILVVVNKRSEARRAIKAERDIVFLHMPEGNVLNEGEVESLDPKEPCIVLEAYRGSRPLIETISAVGIVALMQISLAIMPQFTAEYPSQALCDETELSHFCARREEIFGFRPDHFYVASVKEVHHA